MEIAPLRPVLDELERALAKTKPRLPIGGGGWMSSYQCARCSMTLSASEAVLSAHVGADDGADGGGSGQTLGIPVDLVLGEGEVVCMSCALIKTSAELGWHVPAETLGRIAEGGVGALPKRESWAPGGGSGSLSGGDGGLHAGGVTAAGSGIIPAVRTVAAELVAMPDVSGGVVAAAVRAIEAQFAAEIPRGRVQFARGLMSGLLIAFCYDMGLEFVVSLHGEDGGDGGALGVVEETDVGV